MKALFAAFITSAIVLMSWPTHGQVLRCTDKMFSVLDDRLQRSIVELKLQYPNISFQDDNQPCQHARDTEKALTMTLGRNYLKAISGYEFAKVINGEGYFTVERFKSKNVKDLQDLASALKNNRSHKLKIKANTTYEYFLSEDSIIVIISSVVGRKENLEMFSTLQQSFSPLQATKTK